MGCILPTFRILWEIERKEDIGSCYRYVFKEALISTLQGSLVEIRDVRFPKTIQTAVLKENDIVAVEGVTKPLYLLETEERHVLTVKGNYIDVLFVTQASVVNKSPDIINVLRVTSHEEQWNRLSLEDPIYNISCPVLCKKQEITKEGLYEVTWHYTNGVVLVSSKK